MESGICSNSENKDDFKENIKKGLFIYFNYCSQRSPECKDAIIELVNNWTEDKDFK